MLIRRVRFNNPQLLHLRSEKFYNKKPMLKPAVHKKDWQHTDDIGLFIKN